VTVVREIGRLSFESEISNGTCAKVLFNLLMKGEAQKIERLMEVGDLFRITSLV